MPHAHHHAVLGLRGQLEVRRQRLRDHERVVAPGRERLRDAAKDAGAVVVDVRRLAVHELAGAHDLAAEGDADALVPQADAEHGHMRRRSA